jgi:hypothetical protein
VGETETKIKVTKLFKQLRKEGYVARQNFMCCSGCAIAALPETKKTAFYYHRQDNDDFEGKGYGRGNGMLPIRYCGDDEAEIKRSADRCAELAKSLGLEVDWNGDTSKVIYVK